MKKFILITVLALVTFASQGQPVLVAHYPFNGTANDSVGGNNGVLSNTAIQYIAGHDGTPNSAILLNGINDFIAMPNSSIGAPTINHCTVTAWIRLDAPVTPANWPLVSFGYKYPNAQSNNTFLTLGVSSDGKLKGGNQLWNVYPTDSTFTYNVPGFDLNNYIGQWIPIAYQIRVPSGSQQWNYSSIRFYANGNCLFEAPYYTENVVFGANGIGQLYADTMFVGYGRFDGPGLPSNNQQLFKGAIDDIRIYGALGGVGQSQWLSEAQLDSLFGLPTITTNINEASSPVQFSIYPNPASETININSAGSFQSVDVFNLTGQLVRSENFKTATNATIDVSDVVPGIYMVRLTSASGAVSQQKLIVN